MSYFCNVMLLSCYQTVIIMSLGWTMVSLLHMPLSVPLLTELNTPSKGLEKTTRTSKADLATPDWWWLHSLHLPRMGPCTCSQFNSRQTGSALWSSAAQAFWWWQYYGMVLGHLLAAMKQMASQTSRERRDEKKGKYLSICINLSSCPGKFKHLCMVSKLDGTASLHIWIITDWSYRQRAESLRPFYYFNNAEINVSVGLMQKLGRT